MTTVKLDKDDIPEIIAGKVHNALHTFRQAGGELPAQLEVNPADKERVDCEAVRHITGQEVQLHTSKAVPAGTIRVKPQGSVEV